MSAYHSSRLQYELDLSRKLTLDRELQEISKARSRYRDAEELQYRQFKDVQKLRAEQEYAEYQTRRAIEIREREAEALRERVLREEKQREYEAFLDAERRARLLREEELEIQQRIVEEDHRKKAEALAASRRVELEKQIRIKEDIQRENRRVLEEQTQQQKLEQELRSIDVQIGTIYDDRDNRKRLELVELQRLDEESFRLKQKLRSSTVQQRALEESIAQLAKIIVI